MTRRWFQPSAVPGIREFVCLMAVMTALEAFSIDAMLPALNEIGAALGAQGNQVQLVISSIFLGVAVGQLISGPVSDMIGRRKAVFGFVALYLAGTAVCLSAETMTTMLLGRVLQGFGAAGPYVVAFAIIRDRFEGREMAQIGSWIMTIFILLPVVAPLIGQGLIMVAGWRAVFVAFVVFALVLSVWFAARQPESLPISERMPARPRALLRAAREMLRHRVLLIGTVVEGLLLGGFIAYLSGAQPIFLDLYAIDAGFPLVFAGLSLFIGAAGILNAKVVMRLGMRRMIYTAFGLNTAASLVFLLTLMQIDGAPPLGMTLSYLAVVVFCCGLGFSNVAAMSMEPVESQAGLGASVFGGVSTLLAVPIGAAVGQAYDQTLVPLAIGFLITSAVSIVLLKTGLPASPRA